VTASSGTSSSGAATPDATEETLPPQPGGEVLDEASSPDVVVSEAGESDEASADAQSTDAPPDARMDASAPAAEAGAEAEAGAACHPTIASPPLLPGLHVAIGSDIQWDSNPPSSGPHYPIWAAYQAYDTPVPRGYYVHDLEHGAIVFLFNCGDAGCPNVVAAFHEASDSLPDDPLCTMAGEGVRVRTVITPDPLLDVPVAAAAWGWTYKADCVDLPSLEAFAVAHYGQGPEDFCSNGTTQF